MKYKLFLFCLSLVWGNLCYGQNFDPVKAFAQGFYEYPGNPYRSASGAPGAQYWQNRVNYQLTASFDTLNRILKGNAGIQYENNSPDTLNFLWLYLDYNADRTDGIGKQFKVAALGSDTTTGFHIESIKTSTGETLTYQIYGTRMKIYLNQPLLPKKGKLDLTIRYHLQLEEESATGRAGFLSTKNGAIFEFGYWYPRLCVYDDLRGWNTLPFIGGGEFYCEYGDIDYQITVPSGMIVAGAGTLVNGSEILSDSVLNRLKTATKSNQTVMIHPASELQTIAVTQKTNGTTTWKFQMKNTRDVAFAISKSFVWDAAKADLPDGKTVLVQSFYPPESAEKDNGWQRATEFLKANIEMYSKDWFPYPYSQATSVAGGVGGMEYPGITFDWWKSTGKVLWLLVSHEIGHTWYPMIVGSNERRYPFMDEGFNVFIDILAQDEFNHGEFAPKRDGEYAPKGGNPADEIVPVIKQLQGSYTLMTAPDRMDYKYVHPLAYFKTAFGLVLLRDVILGKDRFDEAFKTYTRRWAFRHPAPNDFFRTMDNVSGEDLTWFWREWFENNWLLDQAIEKVTYKDNDPSKGAMITIVNKEQMVMPVFVEVLEENGLKHELKLPVEGWARGAEWTFEVPTKTRLLSVKLDPKEQMPDADRSNNIWNAIQ